MSLRKLSALSVFAGLAVSVSSASEPLNGLLQSPSISPDASKIVFSAAGDLWSVSSSGGYANRLTSHPGIETQSRFSDDGSMLVFESNRDGAQNIYSLDLHSSDNQLHPGAISRITTSDRAQMLGGFSSDGKSVLVSAYLYPEIYRHPRMYSVPLDGGPITKVSDAFGRGPATNGTDDVYFIRGYYYPHRVAYRGPGNLDIWRMNGSDGSFDQLTEFAGNDMNPCPLPDGSLIYLSSRDGQYNLVRLDPNADDQGANSVTQLTHFKPDEDNPTTIAHGVRDLAVSGDGSTAVFVVWNTMYTLDLNNKRATPQAVDIQFGSDLSRGLVQRKNISRNVSEAALHPSGKSMAQVTRGELFVRSAEEDHPTRRISDSNFRERDIAWSPDGVGLYFTADDELSLGSIYYATVSLALEDILPQPEPDEESEQAEDSNEQEEAGVETDAIEAFEDQDGDGLSDNPTQEEKDSQEEDEESETEEETDEEPKVDYAARWASALRFDIKPVVVDSELAYSPMPSPDGTKLMYLRDRGDIVIRDLDTGDERVVSENWSEPDLQWASDSRHIVFAATDLDFNSDIFLLDTHMGDDGVIPEPINVTMHPDIDHSPQLSHDGKVLTFLSERDNENWEFDVYRVYLDRELDGMRDYEIAQYYEEAIAEAKKLKPIDPVEFSNDDEDDSEDSGDGSDEGTDDHGLKFDADDAYLRIRRLTSTPQTESGLVMTPAADRIAFSTVIDGDRTYVSVDYKGKDRKTIKSGSVGDPRISIDGKTMSYVSGGQASTTSPTGGKATAMPINADITIHKLDELAQKFDEASGRFGMAFYHPTMKGLDWDATSARYKDLVMQTRTNQAFQRLMNLMWGEVDGSHTGTRGGDGFSSSSPGNGYLGADFIPTSDGYRIDSIIEGGPIHRMGNGPTVGDVIVGVGDTTLLDGSTASGLLSLHAALEGAARDEVLLEFTRVASGEQAMALVTPVPYSSMSVMRYWDEVAKRREQVEEMSDGKLGYLHIRSMGLASVRDYERDLYAAANGKEGLIIDVRDNGGGWTTDILLASLTAPNHAYTIPRGADANDVVKDNYPRDRRLIYAYSRPVTVLINQHSFSNAEIFAHSIRNTKRGTLVGTQTFGGVISTGSFSLIDGTTIRRPFRGWYLPDGTDMENNGAKPDIDIPQTPTDEAAGKDPQLEAAVSDLLTRTGN
jgi:tricorn protease